jgi:hypothetical protein
MTQPAEDEIFVFGSNLAGIHGAGSARHALMHLGAEWGFGMGTTGKCYAIPTKGYNIEAIPLSDIKEYIDMFIQYANDTPTKLYFVTRLGCGLAGFKDSDIGPLFKNAPVNCNLPEEWIEYVN